MSKAGKLSKKFIAEIPVENKRQYGNRPRRRYFLIVCEGKETETNYFEAIRKILPPEMVSRITVEGTGKNTLSLVQHTEKEVEDRKKSGLPPYFEIWVVFDRDSFKPDNFDNAITCIESKSSVAEKWHAAWSNEAFELWYILHFRAQAGGQLSRKAYQAILEEEMQRKYQKNATDMFMKLRLKTPLAIKRAAGALKLQERQVAYHDKNPATTVHLLVKKLLSYSD